jgi:hypothetical protein
MGSCCPVGTVSVWEDESSTDGDNGCKIRRGPGTREKVSSRRINLEGNIHAQEINVSQLPV